MVSPTTVASKALDRAFAQEGWRPIAILVAVLAVVSLSGCDEAAPPASQVRPIQTVTVQQQLLGEPIILTGQIRAQSEIAVAFRIEGKLIERPVSIGDRVITGQIVARLDPQNEQNALRSAEADLVAAQATLTQALGTEGRQRELFQKGFTTRAQYEQALQQLQTAQSLVDSAEARLLTARDRVRYTELRAEAAGTVTNKGAEPGEVVRAGQMIVQLARQGGKDAVFDVPAQLIRDAPRDPIVEVTLADNHNVKATGRVREVAPQADPVTRTFAVKIGLSDPPETMRLGATVIGRIELNQTRVIRIPGTALMRSDNKPAVWIFDRASDTVVLRPVEVARYDPSSVIISQGLQDGDVVVTAGVQVLRPGQKVRLLVASP